MDPQKYSVTFACYNQVDYTSQCIDSMVKHGFDLGRLVVVDNGSTDETRNYLQTLPLGEMIFNHANMGCGVAWNQGALALQSEWTVIMYYDVLVGPNWNENLIGTAEQHGLKMISPALIEGNLDYDFNAFAANASVQMKSAKRKKRCHAVCMAVHESVWLVFGFFLLFLFFLGFVVSLFFF